MIRQSTTIKQEMDGAAKIDCFWFDNDEDSSDSSLDESAMIRVDLANMRKQLLAHASEATLATTDMTESTCDNDDDDDNTVPNGRRVTFFDTVQIFEIDSMNEICRDELFYSSDEIQAFRDCESNQTACASS
jgi:hypothetical protein